MGKHLGLLSALLLFFAGLHAQEIRNSIEFSPQRSISVFTANEKLSGTVYGAELIYHFNTEQHTSTWMRSMGLKSIDLAFNYKNMSDVRLVSNPKPGTFGDSYALLAGLNISLLKLHKTELLFSPAFGLGYLGESFFSNGNPLVGSHTNFGSRISLKIATPVGPNTRVAAGIDVLHFSNAAFRVPNNGLNASSLSLSIIQSLRPLAKKSDSIELPHYKKHSVDFGINIGRRGVYQSKAARFRTGLYAGYNFRLSPVLALSSGLDAVYYHSVYDPSDNAGTYQSFATSYEHWRLGLALGPDIWMGRLALMAKYGYYLHYNSLRGNQTYWTAGLKYQTRDWLALQAKIYVHKTEADYAGFGLIFTP